ncbi:MAG: phage major capsid protein [Clostridia bacterium]|nr:phage major capsid protein [Clostridia bacterium]
MSIEEMNLDEIQTRKTEIMARREAIEVELEKAADLDALKDEAEALNAEERALNEREKAINEAFEARQKEIAEVMKTGEEKKTFEERKTMSNMEVRKSPEYANAWAEYIKTGDDTQCRALLTENVSGSVPVSEYAEDRVRTAWQRDGIMSRVRKTYLKGNVKIGFEVSAGDATIHTEASNSAVSEESLVLGVVNLVPQSIKKWISISDEVYDLKGTEFLDYIYDELTYRIAQKAADALIADIEACGTTSTTGAPGVAKITATQVSVGLCAQAMAQLSGEAANPVVIMNKQTWGAFKAAQAANGYNYDPFEGMPVLFNDSITAFSAATTGVTYAIVGDLGLGAQANFPNGDEIEIKFDDKTLMEKDLIRILGREYVGLGVVAPYAFCKIAH